MSQTAVDTETSRRSRLDQLAARITATGLLVCLYLAVYFGTGLPDREASSLASAFDLAIPFHPAAIYVYASAFPLILAPLFLIHDADLFRRTWLGYALCIGLCGLCFWVWPISAHDLRPDLASGRLEGFAAWGVRTLFAIDPPRNCFPSLHVALATTGVLAVGIADRRAGWVAGTWLAALVLAVLVVKQHFVADVAAGLMLGAVAHAAGARRFAGGRPVPEARAPIGTARVLALAGFVSAAYLAVYGIYASGATPPMPVW